jgi:L-threonylcarbamoyladenylate synthase
MGFLPIAAAEDQLVRYVDGSSLVEERRKAIRGSWPEPATWILPRAAGAPGALVGVHKGVAVRVTGHPIAAALCRHFGGAIVSTSANLAGQPPARSAVEVLECLQASDLDGVVDGAVGGLAEPTPIRDAVSGRIVRE